MKKILLLLCWMMLIVFISSCRPEDMRKLEAIFKKELPKPKRVITINQIVKYPRAKEIEKEIDTVTGMKIWINTHAFIHSKSIEKIELIPRDEEGKRYDLKLFLSNHGKIVWMQLSASYSYRKLAFVIDNVFYRSFTPYPIEKDKDYAIIKGPFDKFTAEELKKYSETNFEYFNQKQ